VKHPLKSAQIPHLLLETASGDVLDTPEKTLALFRNLAGEHLA